MTRFITKVAASASIFVLLLLTLGVVGCGSPPGEMGPAVAPEATTVASVSTTSSTNKPATVGTDIAPTTLLLNQQEATPNVMAPDTTLPVVATPEGTPHAGTTPAAVFRDANGKNEDDTPVSLAVAVAVGPTISVADETISSAPGARDSEVKQAPGSTGPVEGQEYSWQDGDRILTVYLQEDLVVDEGSANSPASIVRAQSGAGSIVAKGDAYVPSNDDLPVFRSQSGSLMTLPGGVLLVLNEEWTEAQTNSFFADNGIKIDRVSELDYITNGFFIETDPGFPSLNLANQLASLDGVEVSSPNWWTEAVTR